MPKLTKVSSGGVEPIFKKNICAVIVAIENYRDKEIATVDYAVNDAEAFRDMLINDLAADPKNVVIWRDTDATKATLENDLAYEIRQLSRDDLFIFYYAGHGFHGPSGNRLTVWDSNKYNLEGTTVLVQEVLLTPLANADCHNSMIFLDACASRLIEGLKSRDIISSFDNDEFEDFAKSGDFHALFCSCSPGEKSYPSKVLKHGIWTYHLLEAIKGKQPLALFRKNYITDRSLQDYLSAAVPGFIRKQLSGKFEQSPFSRISTSNTVILRHLPSPKVIAKATPVLPLILQEAYLRSIRVTNVKKLQGFPKGYQPPKWSSDGANSTVQKYAEDDVKEEIDEVYNKARQYFKLKTRQMESSIRRTGGIIKTPYFTYEIDVWQSKSDPVDVIFQRTLFLWAAKNELDTNFNHIFPVMPDDIVIPINGSVDYSQIVDQFEDFEEEHGGKLTLQTSDEILIYESTDGLKFEVDVNNGTIVASSGMGYSILSLIDRVGEGLTKLTGKETFLLPDSDESQNDE